MINTEESHSREGLHEDAEAVDEERGPGLLDDDNVEETVDYFRPVTETEHVGAGMKKAVEAFRGEAHEDAALEEFNDMKAYGLKDCGNDKKRENKNAEHNEWLEQCSERNGIDEGLGSYGHGQSKESDREGKDDGDPEIALLKAQQCKQAVVGRERLDARFDHKIHCTENRRNRQIDKSETKYRFLRCV